jgi:primary-amine oxidase
MTTHAAAATATTHAPHPLDPLSEEEVRAAAAILRGEQGLGETARFVRLGLHEPPKDAVLAHRAGDPVERQAFAVVRETAERTTYEAVVSITRGTVVEWRVRPDVQPPIVFDEFLACERAVRADPRWQAAMRRRGVTDFSQGMIDPWSAGYWGPEDAPDQRRIVRALTWVRLGPMDNGYARPVEGLITEFDLDRLEVVRIEDHGVVPLPARSGDYTPEGITSPTNVPHFAAVREGPRALEITQPDGVSFQVNGTEVRWQNWRFRVGFTAREGLVLHTVSYDDRGHERPVLYRASIAEMFVPYGDPSPTHYRKMVFDEGEYGLGMLANALELGCDCLGAITYFDAVLANSSGEPVRLPNAVCLHEEDFGILWKHLDWRTGHAEVRRSRRLVVSSISTIGNYEYGFFWYFYLDGTIELQLKLTGIISTGAIAPGETPKHGTIVAPGLYGPHHQHYVSVRLDMTVDGPNNTVHEVDSGPLPPGPENPYGNAWVTTETPLRRESEAQRTIDPFKARYWKIVNHSATNALGQPVAYKLMPGETCVPYFQPDAIPLQRGGFAARHLWVTRYDPAELYAAGDYPNQHPGGAGLPAYAAQDRPLEDTDVVLWYTLGAHHVVRPEDWPVMPVTMLGFQLKPFGFFVGNPALDLPPNGDHCAAE